MHLSLLNKSGKRGQVNLKGLHRSEGGGGALPGDRDIKLSLTLRLDSLEELKRISEENWGLLISFVTVLKNSAKRQ